MEKSDDRNIDLATVRLARAKAALAFVFPLSLWACGGLECGEGTHEEAGFCVADGGSSSSGGGGSGASDGGGATSTGGSTSTGGGDPILDALPPCDPVSMDGTLDWKNGCVLGACHDMTYEQINTALGETGFCEPLVDVTLACDWMMGAIQAFFDDNDGDTIPDPDQTAFGLFVEEPFAGGSPEGLGIGATLRCFVDVFGTPEEMEVETLNGEYVPITMDWHSDGLHVRDTYFAAEADGRADSILLYGGF